MPFLSRSTVLCVVLLSATLIAGCLAAGFSSPPAHLIHPGEEHLKQGALLEQQGQWPQAIQEYTQALEYTPRGHIALGRLYAARGQLAEAERSFRQAMTAIRDDASLYNDLAALLLERKHHLDEAEELAMLSVKLADQSQFPVSWDTLNAVRMARQK